MIDAKADVTMHVLYIPAKCYKSITICIIYFYLGIIFITYIFQRLTSNHYIEKLYKFIKKIFILSNSSEAMEIELYILVEVILNEKF